MGGSSAQSLAALVGFAFAAVWTPGPNTFMLAASGATFGLRRTVPHVLGVTFGFPVMLFIITLGLGEVFRTQPALRSAIAWTGVAVMLWLALRLLRQAGAAEGKVGAQPLSFTAVAAFQWVNPKAWVMSIAVAATYASGNAPLTEALIATAIFAAVGAPSALSWAAAGAGLRRFLGTGWRLRSFNAAMAVLLAGSAIALVMWE
ncbi:MAG: LysE family translocator [Pseudomonadota bacterium]